MTIRPIAALSIALTAGLAACASQPSGPPASTTSQSMALPPAAAPASSMPGMSAAEHQRMMQQGQPMQGMDHSRMSAEEHQRMMQRR